MLYFAYGSNMDWDQIRGRCPSARYVATAVLPDHTLAITRESVQRRCGVCDAVPAKGLELWGVVYELDERDVESLDRSEGYRPGREKNSYVRRECLVLQKPGEESLTVCAYFGDPQPNPPRPNEEYKRPIVSGARHWQLPDEYIAYLEQIETA